MPRLFTVPAGQSLAAHAASLLHQQLGATGLAQATVLVPTRRSCVVMRDALTNALDGLPALLPRIVPLADIGDALLTLLGPSALPHIRAIPPAMPEGLRRFLLARQVMAFEARRMQRPVGVDYALTLADSLMALEDEATRAQVALTQEALRPLIARDVADHWKQALMFLSIITDHWPDIARAHGMISAAEREVRALTLLADFWAETPPEGPSTLSARPAVSLPPRG